MQTDPYKCLPQGITGNQHDQKQDIIGREIFECHEILSTIGKHPFGPAQDVFPGVQDEFHMYKDDNRDRHHQKQQGSLYLAIIKKERSEKKQWQDPKSFLVPEFTFFFEIFKAGKIQKRYGNEIDGKPDGKNSYSDPIIRSEIAAGREYIQIIQQNKDNACVQ